ncbi:glycosyltransferase [bacterium]|nr:MAG: glycosyltransferase [bacterium]
MKVLYLFNRVRSGAFDVIKNAGENDNSFFGMYRLPHYGISAEYLEIEQFLAPRFATFLRRHFLNIHYIHLPLFFKFFKYDIIFTSTSFGSLLVKAILGFKKPKWIMFDFSIAGMVGEGKTFRQKVFRFMVERGADGIITISKKEEERVKNLFPKLALRTKFIPLGTDIDFFKPNEGISETGAVLSVGKDPFRDYQTLVDAVKNTDIPLTIVTRPEHIVPFLPLPANISSKTVTTQELLNEYLKAKVFVLPLTLRTGVNEAVGTSTLVEAMAMGKAIVATRTFTMESYIIDGENGILVPEGDSEAMRRAISDLLQNEEKRKRIGRVARDFAMNHCDAEKFARSLSDYFKEIS